MLKLCIFTWLCGIITNLYLQEILWGPSNQMLFYGTERLTKTKVNTKNVNTKNSNTRKP